jgi:hypothetical protein
MIEFTDAIQLNGTTLPVSFTLVFTTKGTRFFVAVEKDGKNHFFDMTRKTPDQWIIENPTAEWMRNLESKLSEAIVKNVDGRPLF